MKQERKWRSWAAWAGVLGLVLTAATAGLAPADETEPQAEREAYVATAEPVCKRNVLANRHIFKGVKAMVKQGRLAPAARRFKRAARAFGKAIGQLAAIPRPPADDSKLREWLGLLRAEKRIVARIGRGLAAGDRHKAESFSVSLRRNSNRANNVVLLFGFKYCRIEASRFG